jgi:hypothetical protein
MELDSLLPQDQSYLNFELIVHGRGEGRVMSVDNGFLVDLLKKLR